MSASERSPFSEAFLSNYYRENSYALVGFIIAKGADHDTAEDIAQQTFLSILSTSRYVEQGKFDAWVKKIALNHLYQYLRKNGKMQTSPLKADLPVTADPFERILIKPLIEKAVAAIRGLPTAQNQAWKLRMHGLCSKEVGKIMQKNPNAIKALWARRQRRLSFLREEICQNEGAMSDTPSLTSVPDDPRIAARKYTTIYTSGLRMSQR